MFIGIEDMYYITYYGAASNFNIQITRVVNKQNINNISMLKHVGKVLLVVSLTTTCYV